MNRMVKPAVQQGRSEPRAEANPLGYVEGLREARTMLAACFTILIKCPRTIHTLGPPNSHPYHPRSRRASPPTRCALHTWHVCIRVGVQTGVVAVPREECRVACH